MSPSSSRDTSKSQTEANHVCAGGFALHMGVVGGHVRCRADAGTRLLVDEGHGLARAQEVLATLLQGRERSLSIGMLADRMRKPSKVLTGQGRLQLHLEELLDHRTGSLIIDGPLPSVPLSPAL